MTPDGKLLRQYVEKHDEAAFAEVVRRHVNLVYAAALRQATGDTALAEDVTQAAFTELVQKAPQLCEHPTVAGWLHASARFLALRSVRGEQRRRAREQEAATMSTPINPHEKSWEQLRPLLDEAVAQLNERDRDALLLRFFEEKSHREVGAVLGLSENVARMRVERALEKLRSYFSRRGVTTTAALLTGIFEAHGATPAPAAFAANVARTSLAHASGASSRSGTNVSSKARRLRFATLVVAILVLLIFWQIRERSSSNSPVKPVLAKQKVGGNPTDHVAAPDTSSAPNKPTTISHGFQYAGGPPGWLERVKAENANIKGRGDVGSFSVVGPLPFYSWDYASFANGGGLGGAVIARYDFYTCDAAGQGFEIYEVPADQSGPTIIFGPSENLVPSILAQLEVLPQVQAGSFEPRILFLGMGFEAIWLKSNTSAPDLFYPLYTERTDPARVPIAAYSQLNLNTLYNADDFMNIIGVIAQETAAFYDRGNSPGSRGP